MKKKIAILGSTGSIGKTLMEIIKKDKKNFEIVLLSADENYKELLKQAKLFNVKNLIITNKSSYKKIKKKKISNKIRIFNDFENFIRKNKNYIVTYDFVLRNYSAGFFVKIINKIIKTLLIIIRKL